MAKRKKNTVEAINSDAIADLADSGLTIKRQAFVRTYLENGGNATDAYRRSHNCAKMGEDTIRVEAYRLRKNPHITLAIERFHKSKAVETLLTVERHMSELKDLREAAKVTGQLSAAVRAEELRGRLCGYYSTKIEHSAPNQFAQMTDQELRDFIVEEARAIGIDLSAPGP